MDPLENLKKKALKNIKKTGLSITGVFEDIENRVPQFSYSIGIEKTLKKPDVIMIGAPLEVSQSIINLYYDKLKKGQVLEQNVDQNEFFQGFPARLISVDKQYYSDWFNMGRWFYGGNNFGALQIVYPDQNGKWPWEHEKDSLFALSQPVLGDPYPE